MSKMRWRLGLTAFLSLVSVLAIGTHRVLSAPDSPPKGPALVMIIRHGEKPEGADAKTDINLAPKGYERAAALATVIPNNFPKPDFLIATKETEHSNRPVETITPLSKALHETIDSTFKEEDTTLLAQAVLTDPKYAGKVVLIAWHHGKIPELAKAFGVKDPPDWNPKVFDRVWEITFENGVAVWKDVPQKALPGDSTK